MRHLKQTHLHVVVSQSANAANRWPANASGLTAQESGAPNAHERLPAPPGDSRLVGLFDQSPLDLVALRGITVREQRPKEAGERG